MYYPGRINQLVSRMQKEDNPDDDLITLSETVGYYKDIYTLLTAQASEQAAVLNFRRHNIPFEQLATPTAQRFNKRTRRLGVDVELSVVNDLENSKLRGDEDLLAMLLNALLDAETDFLTADDSGAGEWQPISLSASVDGAFAKVCITNPNIQLTDNELNTLFSPHRQGIPFLIAKQIIREHDTFMGHPGCRINAEAAAQGHSIWFTVPLTRSK